MGVILPTKLPWRPPPVHRPIPGVCCGPPSFQRVFNSWGACASYTHTYDANALTIWACYWRRASWRRSIVTDRLDCAAESCYLCQSVPAVSHGCASKCFSKEMWRLCMSLIDGQSLFRTAWLQHLRCFVLHSLKNSHTYMHTHTVIPQSICSRADFPPPQPLYSRVMNILREWNTFLFTPHIAQQEWVLKPQVSLHFCTSVPCLEVNYWMGFQFLGFFFFVNVLESKLCMKAYLRQKRHKIYCVFVFRVKLIFSGSTTGTLAIASKLKH